MKLLAFISVLILALPSVALYETPIKSIDESAFSLGQFKNKVVLFVNIATQCGYTPQLKGLQQLHDKYGKQGFAVVGIPSNDFGGQTPQNAAGVQEFCQSKYGVNFPLTEKVTVIGKQKHNLITQILAQTEDKKEIAWNFEKFLFNKEGKLVSRYKSSVDPLDKKLVQQIESLLK